MPTSSFAFDGIIFVKTAPSIRYEDGLFFVRYEVGNISAEFVMRPTAFNAAMVNADVARTDWQQRKRERPNLANVTKLRARSHH